MGAAMLATGPLYAAFAGQGYWAMAVIAAVGLTASVALRTWRPAELAQPQSRADGG